MIANQSKIGCWSVVIQKDWFQPALRRIPASCCCDHCTMYNVFWVSFDPRCNQRVIFRRFAIDRPGSRSCGDLYPGQVSGAVQSAGPKYPHFLLFSSFAMDPPSSSGDKSQLEIMKVKQMGVMLAVLIKRVIGGWGSWFRASWLPAPEGQSRYPRPGKPWKTGPSRESLKNLGHLRKLWKKTNK